MATAMQGILGALNDLARQLPSVDYGEEKFNRWGKPTATIKYAPGSIRSTSGELTLRQLVRGGLCRYTM